MFDRVILVLHSDAPFLNYILLPGNDQNNKRIPIDRETNMTHYNLFKPRRHFYLIFLTLRTHLRTKVINFACTLNAVNIGE